MKKLGPGYNEIGWTMNVKCEGDDGSTRSRKVGCGAPLEIEKNDLYLVHKHDISGPRDEVRFTNLPTKAQWLTNENH